MDLAQHKERVLKKRKENSGFFKRFLKSETKSKDYNQKLENIK